VREIFRCSSHSWKSAALVLVLLPFLAFDISPVWGEPQVSDITVAAFFADPDQILLENPDGGARLAADVRDLALSDPATLPEILSLLPKATKAQKAAIGAGLAKAARMTARSNPGYAKEIQQAVVQTKDADLIQAYDAATTGEYSGLTRGGTGLGSVSDTGALTGPGAPGTFGVPPGFVPGNSAAATTTVPLTNVPVPSVTVILPGPLTAVEVPNTPVPGIPVPGVPESNVTVPSTTVPNVTVPNVTVPNVTVPNVTVPNFTVTAFAVLPRFAPPTPLGESVSPH
jgi:hypothetical protein